jgi:hypothetical protein
MRPHRNFISRALNTIVYTAVLVLIVILAPLASIFGLILGIFAGFIFLLLLVRTWISEQIRLRFI